MLARANLIEILKPSGYFAALSMTADVVCFLVLRGAQYDGRCLDTFGYLITLFMRRGQYASGYLPALHIAALPCEARHTEQREVSRNKCI